MKKINNLNCYLNHNENWNLLREMNLEWNKEEDLIVKKKIEFKIRTIHFKIDGGKVLDKKTDEILTIEDAEYIDSLIEELPKVKDEKLLLRQYLILWNSNKREFNYAQKAIDLIVGFIKDENGSNEIVLLVSNLVDLSISTKYKIESLESTLNSYFKESTIEGYSKIQTLEKILNNKFFESSFFKSIRKDIVNSCDEYISKRRIFHVEHLLKILQKYSSKINESNSFWFSKCAMIYETHADFRKDDDRPIISYDYYIKAKGIFKRAKDSDGERRVTGNIQLLKGKKLLDKVSIPYKYQEKLLEIRNYNIQKADDLLEYSSKDIIDFIVKNGELFPSLKNISLDPETKFKRELIFGKIELDINKNTFGRKKKSSIYLTIEEANSYKENLRLTTLVFLSRLFYIGSLNEKLSSKNILDYLTNYSWFGEPYEMVSSDGQIFEYKWITLLEEHVNFLSSEIIENVVTKEANEPKLIMLLDSLVLKFEGLLREVLTQHGESTIKVIRGESREMTLEDYLENKILQSITPDNDLLLFYYLYTNQGINLRNNISHSFFKIKRQYRYQDLLLVFVSILKVGAIEIK